MSGSLRAESRSHPYGSGMGRGGSRRGWGDVADCRMSLDASGWSGGSFPARTVRSSSRLAMGGMGFVVLDDVDVDVDILRRLEGYLWSARGIRAADGG